jgi:hypothetical protein
MLEMTKKAKALPRVSLRGARQGDVAISAQDKDEIASRSLA